MSIVNYVQLKCSANGFPQPKYRWYTIDTQGRTDSTGRTITWIQRKQVDPTLDPLGRISISGGSLVIHSPNSTSDSAMYQCEAYNSLGNILSRTARIVFGQLETAQKQPRHERRVLAHKSETLPCDPPAHSPADSLLYTIYMNKDGQLEPVLPRYRQNVFISQAKGLIGFSEVTNLDTGIYVCMITMTFNGKSLYDSPKLPNMPFTVMHSNEPRQLPRIYDEFPAVWPSSPQRGQQVRLECFAAGYTQVKVLMYSWRRLDGVPLRTGSLSDFNRVIELPNVQPEDQGEYECNVEDSLGRKATPRTVQLHITAKPYFLSAPQDTLADIGSTVRLQCEASGIPTPQHRWYRNDLPLDELLIGDGRQGQLDPTRYTLTNQLSRSSTGGGSQSSSTLVIINATLADSSMFTCFAWNNLGSRAVSAELRVVELAPTFANHPVLPNEGMVGGAAVMICQPDAAPAAKIEWMHDATMLSPGPSKLDPETGTASCPTTYCLLPNSNLLIAKLTPSEAGLYTCIATNDLGVANSSAYLTVSNRLTFQFQPTNRVAYKNSTVLIPCRVESSPFLDINYAWFFEGVQIKFDRLDLDARRYDQGQLLRPYNRYFGTLHAVNMQFENSGNYTCMPQTPLDSLEASGIVQVAGPPGPCGGVTVDPIVGPHQANISWFPGASHLFPVTYFRLEANSMLEKPDHWFVLVSNLTLDATQLIQPSGRRKTTVEHLAAATAYRIRVIAGNLMGLGEPSVPSLFFTTLATPPTKLPRNVTGGGGKHGTLVIRWIPVARIDQNGPQFRYRAHVRALGNNEYAIHDLWKTKLVDLRIEGNQYLSADPGNQMWEQFTLTLGENLYYKPYQVRLQAVNEKGAGPLTDPVTIMSAARIPANAPRGVSAGAINSSAIRVWWALPTPAEGEGPIHGFRILYWPRIADCRSIESDSMRYKMGQRQTVHGNIWFGRIIGLDPDRYYCIAVQVFNSAGDGPESSFTEQTTFKLPPTDFPTLVKVNSSLDTRQRLGPNTIRVNWNGVQAKPKEEAVEGYRIRYWPAGSQFKQTFEDVDVGIETSGYVTNLLLNTRYYLRVYAYSRGGIGSMSSPVNQFQLVASDKCIPGATWDGPDFRYDFICFGGRGTRQSILLLVVTSVVTTLFWI